jgi:hypothetical protein
MRYFTILLIIFSIRVHANPPATIVVENQEVFVDADALVLKASSEMSLSNLMSSIEKEEAILRIVKVNEEVYVISVLDALPKNRQRILRSSLRDAKDELQDLDLAPGGPRDQEIIDRFNRD